MKYTLPTIGLLVLAITSGVYHFSSNDQKLQETNETMFDRTYFTQFTEETFNDLDYEEDSKLTSLQYKPVITYEVSHNLVFNQNPKDLSANVQVQNVKIDAICDVQPIYDTSRNIIQLAVSYSKLNKNGHEHQVEVPSDADSSMGNISTSSNYHGDLSNGEKTMGSYDAGTFQDRFFIVEVNKSSGQVISVKAEDHLDEDQHVNWMTQQLINDIMPDSRTTSYGGNVRESDNLGTFNARYTAQNYGSLKKITKQYTHNDYVQKHAQHMEMPAIRYNREVHLDNVGIAQKGSSTHSFTIGTNENAIHDQHTAAYDHLGKMSGNISQSFRKISSTENLVNLSREMKRYRTQAHFHNIDLHQSHKGSVELGNGQHVNLQSEPFVEDDHIQYNSSGHPSYFGTHYGRLLQEESDQEQQELQEVNAKEEQELLKSGEQPAYQHSHTMAQVKVFHQRIHADLNYLVYTKTSKLEVQIKVNDHLITNLAEVQWNNCKNKPMNNNKKKHITLFKATFPLFGIITIPVEASIDLDYGWNAGLTAYTRHCDFHFNPYFKGSLLATGQASIVQVISAGIYAKGTFLDANLTFKIASDQGRSFVSLDGNYRAFTLDIGATWTKLNCSPKHWFGRHLEEVQPSGVKRQLHWHHHFHFHVHRFVHKVTHVVKKALKYAGQVTKVIRNGIPAVLGLFCKKSQGFKQLVRKNSPQYHKQWFNKSVNIGI